MESTIQFQTSTSTSGERELDWDGVMCHETFSSSLTFASALVPGLRLSRLAEPEERLILWSLPLEPAVELPGKGPEKSLETEKREEPPGLEGGFGKT